MARRRPGQDPTAGPRSGTAPGRDSAVFVISVAAELTGLHPQTLRTYERMGLIQPGRTGGGGRRYSPSDIDLLRQIASLTAEGIGIEGVRRILELENQVTALRQRNSELVTELQTARDALTSTLQQAAAVRRGEQPPSKLPAVRPPDPGQSVVVWRRQR